jgi:DNA repair ATPase RecN
MRVTEHKKSKAGREYPCEKCPDLIVAGDQYFEWTPYKSASRRQHSKHGHPTQSQLTTSKLSGVYSAIEDASASVTAAEDVSDIAQALRDCATTCEEVKGEYEEALEALPDGLRDSSDMQEKVDALDTFLDSLNTAADEVDGTSFEDEKSEPSLDDEEKHEEWVENKEAWLQEQRDAADTALGEFEL